MKTILLASAMALASTLPAQAHSYTTGTYSSGYYGCGSCCGSSGGGYYPGYDALYGHRHYTGTYYWPNCRRPDIIVYERPYVSPCNDPCRYPVWNYGYGSSVTPYVGY